MLQRAMLVDTYNLEGEPKEPGEENTKQVEQFLGLVNYHLNFIKDFAAVAVPLYRITGKRAFCWEATQKEDTRK